MPVESGNGSRVSKYAKKKQELASGLRAPFEFKESAEREPAVVEATKQIVPLVDEKGRRIVDATAVRVNPDHDCAFLETSEGEEIFLSLRLLRRDCGESTTLDIGWNVRCVVKENKPPLHGVSSRVVLSATPP